MNAEEKDRIRECIRRADALAFWREVRVVREARSTQDELKKAAPTDAPAPQLLLALRQSAGRGTQGRPWHSPEGGLWLSALLSVREETAPWLGFAGVLAMARALEALSPLRPSVKWPNDLLVEDRKAGGVLLERWPAPYAEPSSPLRETGSVRSPANPARAVLGLGLNVNLTETDFPPALCESATSLRLATGRTWPLGEVAALVAQELALLLRELEEEGPGLLLPAIESRLAWRGERVVLREGAQAHCGRIDGLDSDGALRLMDAAGNATSHRSGRCERMAAPAETERPGQKPRAKGGRLVPLLLLGLALGGMSAQADILYLKDGTAIEGRVTAVPQGYRIQTRTGKFVVPEARVAQWLRKPLPEEEYLQRKAAAGEDDLEAQFALALWCRAHALEKEADFHFRRVFALEPDHAAARRAAGYVSYEGRWLTREAYMEAKGFARYGRQWLPREEADLRLSIDRAKADLEQIRASVWKILERIEKEPESLRLPEDAEELSRLGAEEIGLQTHLCQNKVTVMRLRMEAQKPGGKLSHEENIRLANFQNELILSQQSDLLSPFSQSLYSPLPQVRAVAIHALGLIPDSFAAALLIRRIPYELAPWHLERIAQVLAKHPKRTTVLQNLVGTLIYEPHARARERLRYAIEVLADPAVLPLLIEQADYAPLEEGERASERAAPSAGTGAAMPGNAATMNDPQGTFDFTKP
ncbi:MAG: biotin--[acetyl-CoA-carboxylase] ligase, partial [Planctomycetota bacterium]